MEEPTRKRVRAAIGQVGGYWRPLAAVARLQEELGELAELLLAPAPEPQYCAAELADLWIITTAVADQFLGCVAEPDSYPRRSPVRDGVLADVVVAAGRIARIVNYYDGPKIPRAFEGWMSLSDAVARLHRALASVAHSYEIDLAAAVSAKLDAIPARDSGRFQGGAHDPSTAASLEAFGLTSEARGALGLKRSRLWGSPEWTSGSLASNARAIVADLIVFTKAAPWEHLDGYVVSGPAHLSVAVLEDWRTRLLSEISARDPGSEHPLLSATGREVGLQEGEPAPAPVGGELFFNGLPMSVTVLSSLYDPPDRRHSTSGSFVLLRVAGSATFPAR